MIGQAGEHVGQPGLRGSDAVELGGCGQGGEGGGSSAAQTTWKMVSAVCSRPQASVPGDLILLCCRFLSRTPLASAILADELWSMNSNYSVYRGAHSSAQTFPTGLAPFLMSLSKPHQGSAARR